MNCRFFHSFHSWKNTTKQLFLSKFLCRKWLFHSIHMWKNKKSTFLVKVKIFNYEKSLGWFFYASDTGRKSVRCFFNFSILKYNYNYFNGLIFLCIKYASEERQMSSDDWSIQIFLHFRMTSDTHQKSVRCFLIILCQKYNNN